MDNSIKISEKFGLNPSIDTCTICGNDIGIVLLGESYVDPKSGEVKEAPKYLCTGNICDECKKIIDNGGIFFVECNNNVLSGNRIAIKEEAVKNWDIDYNKINFISPETYQMLVKQCQDVQ